MKSSSANVLVTDAPGTVLRNARRSQAFAPFGAGGHPGPAFNGEWLEPTLGQYLLGQGYRTFNPQLMRFTSPDSFSPFDAGGLNAYVYCLGDPVNRVDPTGHIPYLSKFWAWLRRRGRSKATMVSKPTAGSAIINSSSALPRNVISFKPMASGNTVAAPLSANTLPAPALKAPPLPSSSNGFRAGRAYEVGDINYVVQTARTDIHLKNGTTFTTERITTHHSSGPAAKIVRTENGQELVAVGRADMNQFQSVPGYIYKKSTAVRRTSWS
ncbi:RHS repeat-associated core domain-containing protein [Pseudomonas sp. MWU16-30317]|uniref:RHS repeat-associated core domain-containing protein n=1 Tax=Pseudomonas sp. MWU16-30317 TaxID=2878095 RepID=UPI001CFA626E|nr:RHS repeat-associated core domain-containing protein [Pseudomonas sp. MWU16-30317]